MIKKISTQRPYQRDTELRALYPMKNVVTVVYVLYNLFQTGGQGKQYEK